ncbi:lipase family protein [Neobacillus mesonae]|nr:lipase family protein [Neobacillus mesonae]
MSSEVFNRDEAMRWGSFIKRVYEADLSAGEEKLPTQIQLPPNWKLVGSISIEPSLLNWHSEEYIGCIVQSLTNPDRKAIIYRGTAKVLEWIDDFNFFLLSYTEPGGVGKVEEGFARMYRSLKVVFVENNKSKLLTEYIEELNSSHLTIAGHSLGGALSVLTAFASAFYRIETEVYTFGSPMVGDQVFISAYEQAVPNTFRIYNVPDIVPKLPSHELGYVQPERGIEISSLNYPAIGRGISQYHKLDTYLHCIAQFQEEQNPNNEKVG